MLIVNDLVGALKQGATISTILQTQQSYHEQRRWSADELFERRRLANATAGDRAALWHASRAELTTQPAGIRLAVDGIQLADEIRDSNPVGSNVLHVAAA